MRLPPKSIVLVAAAAIGLVCVASETVAQYISVFGSQPTASKSRETSLEGASLQTVSEQEQFKLRRAKEFAEEGDARSAIALWQSVLDAAGSQLLTRDEWKFASNRHEYPKYVTVAHEIESILAELSTEGLDAYRFRADGEARAILANPDGRSRSEVLSEVVRRFFISSVGDEAAFELACLKLDRFEFTGASRLLRKCLEEHPDCTVPKNEILLRLAVANSRIGDTEAAEQALKELSKAASDDQRVSMIRKDVSNGESRRSVSNLENNWPLKYGSSDRSATMRGLAESAFPDNLSELWSQQFDVYSKAIQANPNMGVVYASGTVSYTIDGSGTLVPITQSTISTNSKSKIDRRVLVDQWQQSGWSPVGGLLFHEGLVYFKRDNRVMCCSTETGEMVWLGLRNEFEVDPATRQKSGMQWAQLNTGSTKPKKSEEIQLFGDQVYQAMSIGDGNFYSIEGRTGLDAKTKAVPAQASPFGYNMTVPPRARRNWLTAYHAINGKLRWRREARDAKIGDSNFDVGFSSAPVSGGGLTYVTINDTGAVWLLALNPKDGSTVWKTLLCDEPTGSCAAWATTGISYSEGDVYVGTGAGIVAAVDGVAGALRWAVRYERSGNGTTMPNPYGQQVKMSDVTGWREDVVVATGRGLIVMASDSPEIFALDQRTGKILWDSPRSTSTWQGWPEKATVDYFMGMNGDRLFVGGEAIVRCYDAAGGRVLWETSLDGNSAGTGIVTEDAIYVPQDSSVARLSLRDGKELSRSKFVTMTREPVGNLYSDGNRLFGVGVARAYAMTNLRERIDDLDKRVAANEIDAVLERARLRRFQGDLPATWKDVDTAYELLADSSSADKACEVTIDLLAELNLPTLDPEKTLRKIHKMNTALSDAKPKSKSTRYKLLQRIEDNLHRSFISIKSNKTTGLTEQILALATICDSDYLTKQAGQAIQATCSADDFETLKESLESDHLPTRQIAASGIEKLGKQGIETFKELMDGQPPEELRMQVAIALLNAGDSDALVDLGQLIESENAAIQSAALAALKSITQQNFDPGTVVTVPSTVVTVPSTGRPSPDKPDDDADSSLTEKWQKWIEDNRKTAKLQLPYTPMIAARGRTLISNSNGNIEEYDSDGKKQWSVSVGGQGAVCGLANGHRLVASMSTKIVTEYDAAGSKVWSQTVDGSPRRISRLENGNTLVATQNPGKVIELRKDGSIAWDYATSGNPVDAKRMDNGQTLITLSEGKIIKVDAAGGLVWSKRGLSRPVSAQALPNGNIFVALAGESKVVEMTSDGSIVWTQKADGLTDAMRTADGRTVVATTSGVHLYSPDGRMLKGNVPHLASGSRNVNTFRSSMTFSGGVYRSNNQQYASQVYRY